MLFSYAYRQYRNSYARVSRLERAARTVEFYSNTITDRHVEALTTALWLH